MGVLLELGRIAQSYGARQVVQEMSFSLQEGEIACLLGSSGCGKTTVLRCIAGFEKLSGGEIRLAGEVIASRDFSKAAHLRQVGMVFQDYALFPHLDVAANVAFGLHGLSSAERKARVMQMLEVVGLAQYANAYPHELSGGQQQRVALARALAPKPRLLLLDEPFSNLDVDLRQRLSQEVRNILKSQGMTAILVTHDQQEAFAMADKVGIMHQGRLEQWAAPYELYHVPATPYVADFIGQGAFVPATISGERCVELEVGEYCSVEPLPFRIGDKVRVLLRPDDVVHDDHSALTAVIRHKVFQGSDFMYTLSLPSGQEVLALVPSHHDHAVGEAIGIRLELDHLIAFAQI